MPRQGAKCALRNPLFDAWSRQRGTEDEGVAVSCPQPIVCMYSTVVQCIDVLCKSITKCTRFQGTLILHKGVAALLAASPDALEAIPTLVGCGLEKRLPQIAHNAQQGANAVRHLLSAVAAAYSTGM